MKNLAGSIGILFRNRIISSNRLFSHFFGMAVKMVKKNTIKFNRFVIATQDIKAGELLLSEMPLVCGPYWDTKINCLNCYAPSDTMCK